jgi:hypothetical protein
MRRSIDCSGIRHASDYPAARPQVSKQQHPRHYREANHAA